MEEYKLVEKIGNGSHGTVYLLKSIERNRCVVCKSVINKHKNHAYKEIAILSKLRHRRVVRLIDSVVLENSVFLILEHMNHGSLESMVSFFGKSLMAPTPSLGWSMMSQVADALHYIHSKNVIHRDIKPSNILVSRICTKHREFLEFKVCDFSLSTRSDGLVEDGCTIGTPFYMAPEVVAKSGYDCTVDCWGLGCCVYELLSLRKPFDGSTREELFQSITKREVVEGVSTDEVLDGLIKLCLKKCNRITSKAIVRHEKVRLNLAILEVRFKESRIEELEKKIEKLEKINRPEIK